MENTQKKGNLLLGIIVLVALIAAVAVLGIIFSMSLVLSYKYKKIDKANFVLSLAYFIMLIFLYYLRLRLSYNLLIS